MQHMTTHIGRLQLVLTLQTPIISILVLQISIHQTTTFVSTVSRCAAKQKERRRKKWSRVSALPRRPAAYKAAALLTELTRHHFLTFPSYQTLLNFARFATIKTSSYLSRG